MWRIDSVERLPRRLLEEGGHAPPGSSMMIRKAFQRWSARLQLLLAGWRPHRDVWDRLRRPDGLPAHAEAKRILSRYGQLRIGPSNDFTVLDPSVGDEIREPLRWCERVLGRSVYPLGYSEHQDRNYLLVDEAGVIYDLSLDSADPAIPAELRPLASSFEKLLPSLVTGSFNVKELREDLDAIGLRDERRELTADAGPSSRRSTAVGDATHPCSRSVPCPGSRPC